MTTHGKLKVCKGCNKPFMSHPDKNGQNATSCSAKCAHNVLNGIQKYQPKKKCLTCQEKKLLEDFDYNPLGTYRKEDICKTCAPKDKQGYFFNGTFVSNGRRMNSNSDFFKRKMQPLGKLKSSMRAISDRESVEIDKEE